LVRVLPQHPFRAQAHELQRLRDARPRLGLSARQLELLDHYVEDVVDFVEGIVGFVGVLQDCLHLAPERARLPARQVRDVGAVIKVTVMITMRRLEARSSSC